MGGIHFKLYCIFPHLRPIIVSNISDHMLYLLKRYSKSQYKIRYNGFIGDHANFLESLLYCILNSSTCENLKNLERINILKIFNDEFNLRFDKSDFNQLKKLLILVHIKS